MVARTTTAISKVSFRLILHFFKDFIAVGTLFSALSISPCETKDLPADIILVTVSLPVLLPGSRGKSNRSAFDALLEFKTEDYHLDQIACIVEVQLQRGNMKVLSSILDQFASRSDIVDHDTYKRGLAWLAFNHGRYNEVYSILENHPFQPPFHGELQDLWYQARYMEAEKARGRSLGAVDKYRLRRKWPLPSSIWDGEETIYCFKEKSRVALKVKQSNILRANRVDYFSHAIWWNVNRRFPFSEGRQITCVAYLPAY